MLCACIYVTLKHHRESQTYGNTFTAFESLNTDYLQRITSNVKPHLIIYIKIN